MSPIYQYWCVRCGHKFELQRQMTFAKLPAHCPKCGSKATLRPSMSTFRFNPPLR